MIEGQLGDGKQVAPTVGRKGDVCGREHREEVIRPCANGPLRLVGAVIKRRDTLKKAVRSDEISLSRQIRVRG